MKHKGSTFQYKDQFTKDLYNTYLRIRREHLNKYGRISTPLLNYAIANAPAQRFYTSEEQAAKVIRRMLYKGDTFPRMKSTTKEMYLEILSRVKARLKRNPKQPIQPLIEQILMEPAPKFYITPQSVHIIICRIRNQRKAGKDTTTP